MSECRLLIWWYFEHIIVRWAAYILVDLKHIFDMFQLQQKPFLRTFWSDPKMLSIKLSDSWEFWPSLKRLFLALSFSTFSMLKTSYLFYWFQLSVMKDLFCWNERAVMDIGQVGQTETKPNCNQMLSNNKWHNTNNCVAVDKLTVSQYLIIDAIIGSSPDS